MSMLSQALSVIIDCGTSAPGHDKEVVDCLNCIGMFFPLQLMSTVQLLGEKGYDI